MPRILQWLSRHKGRITMAIVSVIFLGLTLFFALSKPSSDKNCSILEYNVNYNPQYGIKNSPITDRGKGDGVSGPELISLALHTAHFSQLPVKVLEYHLFFGVNLTENHIIGRTNIRIKVVKPTIEIKLHAVGLRVIRIYVDSEDSGALRSSWRTDDKFIFVILEGGYQDQQEYVLHIQFRRALGCPGFYLYNGTDGMIGATSFFPTYARNFYPCFDYPNIKTSVKIILSKPSNYTVLSNAAVGSSSQKRRIDVEFVRFLMSDFMSPHHVAFVVGSRLASSRATVSAGGVGIDFPLAVYGRHEIIHLLENALRFAKSILETLIRLFSMSYPFMKLDLVALPGYPSRCLSHPGLIIFNENFFLLDEENSSAQDKIDSAITISQGLIRQWIGNMVTFTWWNDYWLFEAYVMFMARVVVEEVKPGWPCTEMSFLRRLQECLYLVGLDSTAALDDRVQTDEEILALVNSPLAQCKGPSLITSLEMLIGRERFDSGVTDFLNKHMFATAGWEQFLNRFDDSGDMHLINNMALWISQPGYPVVSVTRCRRAGARHIFSQTRFRHHQENISNYRWNVPVCYETSTGDGRGVQWLPAVTVDIEPRSTWFKLNCMDFGFYRSNYSSQLWGQLSRALQDSPRMMSCYDRSNLLDDAFQLADAGLLHYSTPLQLSTYLVGEKELMPLETAYRHLGNIYDKLLESPFLEMFVDYHRSLVKDIYETMDWNGQAGADLLNEFLRMRILIAACELEVGRARSSSRAILLDQISRPDNNTHAGTLPPTFADIIFYCGMLDATLVEWEAVLKMYQTEANPHNKRRLRRALSAPLDEALLDRSVELILSEDSHVDGRAVLGSRPEGRAPSEAWWKALRRSWSQLARRPILRPYLAQVLLAAAASAHSHGQLLDIEQALNEMQAVGVEMFSSGILDVINSTDVDIAKTKGSKDILRTTDLIDEDDHNAMAGTGSGVLGLFHDLNASSVDAHDSSKEAESNSDSKPHTSEFAKSVVYLVPDNGLGYSENIRSTLSSTQYINSTAILSSQNSSNINFAFVGNWNGVNDINRILILKRVTFHNSSDLGYDTEHVDNIRVISKNGNRLKRSLNSADDTKDFPELPPLDISGTLRLVRVALRRTMLWHERAKPQIELWLKTRSSLRRGRAKP